MIDVILLILALVGFLYAAWRSDSRAAFLAAALITLSLLI